MQAEAATIAAPPRTFAPPPRADIVIHLTPFAPRIPADAPLHAPCRWMRLYNVRPYQALAQLCARIERTPYAVRLAQTPQNEVEVIGRVDGEEQTMAIIVEGLTLEAALQALVDASHLQ